MEDRTSLAACTTSGGKKPCVLPSPVMDGLMLLLALGVVLVEDEEDDMACC